MCVCVFSPEPQLCEHIFTASLRPINLHVILSAQKVADRRIAAGEKAMEFYGLFEHARVFMSDEAVLRAVPLRLYD